MKKKGFFSSLKLSIAKDYVYPASRKKMITIGVVSALLILVILLVNIFYQESSIISNGPLSSNHASLSDDCAACHASFASVADENCSVCHEKYGDKLGVYTFAAHYIYRSNDFTRVVAGENESQCYSCHTEHQGRNAKITQVPDARCQTCHDFDSFNHGHPQFEFVTKELKDKAGIKFPHVRHVAEVMNRQKLDDIEKACLHCHNTEPDGKNFQPISFDQHCDTCHLPTSVGTPRLRIQDPDDKATPGVETLESIQERLGAAALWAFYTNPNDFKKIGSRITKRPVYHKDPWILENLKMLREQIYPDPGLAGLLITSPTISPRNSQRLYEEAIQTLQSQAIGLRSRPESEIQSNLIQIDSLLQTVTRKIKDPYEILDETKFLLGDVTPDPQYTPDQLETFTALMNDLTEPCRQCHYIENGSIMRVQKDQSYLYRAEFDHRAHILQRRCLDCHTRISIFEAVTDSGEIEVANDNADIQNLPPIEQCQQCHTSKKASNNCVTCHYFHPNKDYRSSLLLYLD